jgi:peptide/nickel transport system permease protein
MSISYLVRRVLSLIPALFSVLVITFIIVHAIPGDPAQALAGEGADPARVAEIRHQYGFDHPLLTQFVDYVGNVAHGNLGVSTTYGLPVSTVIQQRIGPTLLLTGSALAVSTLLALGLGILSARRPFGPLDTSIGGISLIAYAVPAFWLAQIAILILALRLNVFPLGGYSDARHMYTGLQLVIDVAYHLVLPAAVLAASELALLTRVTRTGLLREMGQDYIRTARAKGASEAALLLRHALRNAMLPVVTVIGSRIGTLLSGAVVIEAAFGWPGLGSVLVAAADNSDREMMLGLVLVVAAGVLVTNLVTDLLYGWIDPRVRAH